MATLHATFGLLNVHVDDAHGQIKSTTPLEDEKHTESIEPEEKETETVKADKESDASVVVAKVTGKHCIVTRPRLTPFSLFTL